MHKAAVDWRVHERMASRTFLSAEERRCERRVSRLIPLHLIYAG